MSGPMLPRARDAEGIKVPAGDLEGGAKYLGTYKLRHLDRVMAEAAVQASNGVYEGARCSIGSPDPTKTDVFEFSGVAVAVDDGSG